MISSSHIRNFCIIAHIDHGKSTLCDRLLELTQQITKGQSVERILDSNPISRERGITIKLAPVTMNHIYKNDKYQFNMIDTPGHVDFHYEVSRSLAACEGAILVVDASQGVQAQTLSYWQKAIDQGLDLIPVINKIDLPTAQTEKVKVSLHKHFGFDSQNIICISAKTGEGVDQLLDRVVTDINSPKGQNNQSLQALVFDSFYHSFKGVVAYLRVKAGQITSQDLNQLKFVASGADFKGLEIGIFQPDLTRVSALRVGEVGYLATGLKDIAQARVGDTLTSAINSAPAVPGYKTPQPVVFLNFFPADLEQFELLRDGLSKLKLNDASLSFKPVFSEALGKGFRCGFLGLLHSEIIQERLENEFDLNLVATHPSVLHQIEKNGKRENVYTASDMPAGRIEVWEPYVRATIFTPEKYLGSIFKLCNNKRGTFVTLEHFGLQAKIVYDLPLSEIIVDFFDLLKAVSSGFASFDYEITGFKKLKAARLDILIHKQAIGALSQIVPRDKAYLIGSNLIRRLKEVVPRQMFEFSVQAAIGGKIIAKETIRAYRKNVTAKLYGGDQTRKDKLLKKQAKGKKRMRQIGKVVLPQEAFLAVLKRN
jgi:GTP-binding protein LepA